MSKFFKRREVFALSIDLKVIYISYLGDAERQS